MNDVQKLASGEVEVAFLDRYSNDVGRIMVNSLEAPSWRARLAVTLIEKWGMVSGAPDGEDSAGRAKSRLLTPSEVVIRACMVADMAVATFRDRGWIDAMPSLTEMDKEDTHASK